MKKIALFPGQGSQYMGMGLDFCQNFKVAKEVFEEVNDTLSKNLSKIIFEGPEEELILTENTQNAIMTVSMAILKVMEAEFGRSFANMFNYAAGHSLGEYSALCASESFSLPDTAKLLKIRGSSMQKANPLGVGGMAAILGMEIEKLKENLIENCFIANDNSKSQIVISGYSEAIDAMASKVKELGYKAIRLKVSAAFHSPLMESASYAMQEAFKDVKALEPKVKVIANVTADLHNKDTIKDLLVEQVTAPVRWRETMNYMNENDINLAIEIGPGQVLTSLLKREYENIEAVSISKVSDLENLSKYFK